MRTAQNGSDCPWGWQQPLELYTGQQPGCPPCGCEPAQGGGCELVVTRYSDPACTFYKDGPTGSTSGTCVNVDESSSSQAQGYALGPPTANPGSCAASPITVEPLMPPWTVCELDSPAAGPCGSGQSCVPRVAGQSEVCVLIDGYNVSCPSGYPAKLVLYGSADDQRACGCECGVEVGASCSNGSIALYNTNACGQLMATMAAPSSCFNAATETMHDSYLVQGTVVHGTCPPIDVSTGEVGYGFAMTLCCPGDD